jgi:hypothetical protein
MPSPGSINAVPSGAREEQSPRPERGFRVVGAEVRGPGAVADLGSEAGSSSLPTIASRSRTGTAAHGRFDDVGPGGEQLTRFRCVGCGYGASCRVAPERCPMCGGGVWEYQQRPRLSDLDRAFRAL